MAVIFSNEEATQKCLSNAQKLLEKDGVCLIFAGGRGLTSKIKEIITSSYRHHLFIKYGSN